MWNIPSYHERSPGLRFADEAIRLLGIRRLDTLCDWGCGTGKALTHFASLDILATGVDIAHNSSSHWAGPLFIGAIHEVEIVPSDRVFDFSYCTDVMEHIPPVLVLPTLQKIRQYTRRKAFFSIANFIDREGEKIGETLHLCLRPMQWWCEMMVAAGWPAPYFEERAKHHILVCGK